MSTLSYQCHRVINIVKHARFQLFSYIINFTPCLSLLDLKWKMGLENILKHPLKKPYKTTFWGHYPLQILRRRDNYFAPPRNVIERWYFLVGEGFFCSFGFYWTICASPQKIFFTFFFWSRLWLRASGRLSPLWRPKLWPRADMRLALATGVSVAVSNFK